MVEVAFPPGTVGRDGWFGLVFAGVVRLSGSIVGVALAHGLAPLDPQIALRLADSLGMQPQTG